MVKSINKDKTMNKMTILAGLTTAADSAKELDKQQFKIRYNLLVDMDNFIDDVINDFNKFIKELKTVSRVEDYDINTAFYISTPKGTKAYPDHLEDIDLSLEELLATTITIQFKVIKKADKSIVVNFNQKVGPFDAKTNFQKIRSLIYKTLENMINIAIKQ